MTKPEITPIITNRDVASPFLVEVQESAVKPIEPVFLDYQKDMSQLKAKSDIPVLYKQNVANDLFQLIYVFDMGNNHDKALGTAFDYLEYLGTSDMTPEELKSEFYRLVCTFYVSPGNERTYVVLSGLNENMPAAVQLFEKLLADAQVNKEAYTNMTSDILKARSDAKLNRGTELLPFDELCHVRSQIPCHQSTDGGGTDKYESTGTGRPDSQSEQLQAPYFYTATKQQQRFTGYHQPISSVPAAPKDIPAGNEYAYLETPVTKVLVAPYDAKQIYMAQISNLDKKYDPAIEPIRALYDEYFGGA